MARRRRLHKTLKEHLLKDWTNKLFPKKRVNLPFLFFYVLVNLGKKYGTKDYFFADKEMKDFMIDLVQKYHEAQGGQAQRITYAFQINRYFWNMVAMGILKYRFISEEKLQFKFAIEPRKFEQQLFMFPNINERELHYLHIYFYILKKSKLYNMYLNRKELCRLWRVFLDGKKCTKEFFEVLEKTPWVLKRHYLGENLYKPNEYQAFYHFIRNTAYLTSNDMLFKMIDLFDLTLPPQPIDELAYFFAQIYTKLKKIFNKAPGLETRKKFYQQINNDYHFLLTQGTRLALKYIKPRFKPK